MGGGLTRWEVVWHYGRWSDATGVTSCSGITLLSVFGHQIIPKNSSVVFFFGLIYIDVQDFFVEQFWDVAR